MLAIGKIKNLVHVFTWTQTKHHQRMTKYPIAELLEFRFLPIFFDRPGHHIPYATLIQIAAGSMLNSM